MYSPLHSNDKAMRPQQHLLTALRHGDNICQVTPCVILQHGGNNVIQLQILCYTVLHAYILAKRQQLLDVVKMLLLRGAVHRLLEPENTQVIILPAGLVIDSTDLSTVQSKINHMT